MAEKPENKSKKRFPVVLLAAIPVVGAGTFLLAKHFLEKEPVKQEPEPEQPVPTEIPNIDPILTEIANTIATLQDITNYLRSQVSGAETTIQQNSSLILEAQKAIAEAQEKLRQGTLTNSDAENLLNVLKKLLDQLAVNNQLLAVYIMSMKQALDRLQATINALQAEVNNLKYQLEPVITTSSVTAGGTTGHRSRAVPFTISLDQVVNITGYAQAEGAWPFGCSKAIATIRDRSGRIIIQRTVQSCWHLFTSDGVRRINISENISLPVGQYVIEASGEGAGGWTVSLTARYRTARFLAEGR